jgi:hypothetical protein
MRQTVAKGQAVPRFPSAKQNINRHAISPDSIAEYPDAIPSLFPAHQHSLWFEIR